MPLTKKAPAMAAGLVAALTAATVAQPPSTPGRPETLEGLKCTIDFIEKSDVSALREGVIEKMEAEVGDPVDKGGTIGYLHREMAELTVKKADLAAKNVEIRGDERTRGLVECVGRDLAPREALERGERDGQGRVQVCTGDPGGDVDADRDPDPPRPGD